MNAQEVIRRAERWNTICEWAWKLFGIGCWVMLGYMIGSPNFRFWWPGR